MSRLPHRAALVAATALLWAVPVWAQTPKDGNPAAPIAPLEQAGSLYGERAQVEAGTGEGSATISVELSHHDFTPREPVNGVLRSTTDSFSVVLSTPWNGDDNAEPATLDGLANGTKLTLRFGQYVSFTRPLRTSQMRSIEAEARRVCHEAAQKTFDEQMNALQHSPHSEDTEASARRERLLAAELEHSLDACEFPPGGWGNLVNQHRAERSQEYLGLYRPRGSFEWGLEASIGRNGFEYVDPISLAERSATKVQWGARAYYTGYLLSSPTAWTISAAYQRSYNAADEAVLCPANPNNVVITCTSAAAGPPRLDENLLLSVGLRHQFASSGLFGNMAIAPLITYDFVDDEVGVDLPIYIISNSDGGLIGGVRFGYHSNQEDEFTVSVFIGAAFSLFQ